jgi:hypothetical protein
VRRWQFIGQGGDQGQNTVFKAYSRQYNPFSFVAAEKKWKKKFMRGRRSPVRRTARSATDGVGIYRYFLSDVKVIFEISENFR